MFHDIPPLPPHHAFPVLSPSLIDVLSLLHSFVFALHISRTLPRLPSLGLGSFAKTLTVPLKPNVRLLAVARLYRHGRYLVHPPPRHVTSAPTYKRHPSSPHPSYFSFPLVLYIALTLYCTITVLLPIPGNSNEGPRAAWLLSTIVMYLVQYRRALVCQHVGSRSNFLSPLLRIGMGLRWQCQSRGMRLPVRF